MKFLYGILLVVCASCSGSRGVVAAPGDTEPEDEVVEEEEAEDEEVVEEEPDGDDEVEDEGEDDETEPEIDPTETVTVQRDAFGVPHVFADSDAGAFYGVGYSVAQDRLFQMHWLRLIIRGRASEFFGPGEANEWLDHDRRMRLTGLGHVADVAANKIPKGSSTLLDAFVRGVNAYALSADAVLHPFFAQFGIPVEPWTRGDAVSIWLFAATRFAPEPLSDEAFNLDVFEILSADFGEEAAIAFLSSKGPVDEEAPVVLESDVPDDVKQAMADFADELGIPLNSPKNGPGFHYSSSAPKFSHAWAVTAERSSTDAAQLFGDPRSHILSPSFFYEWHAVGETFDVRGVGPAGSLNLLVGATEDVAWSATSIGADVADLFVLTTDAAHPDQYFFDGEWLDFTKPRQEFIRVKGAPNETVLYRETVWGPDVTGTVEHADPGESYALKSVFLDVDLAQSFRGFLRMYRARTAEQFGTALGYWFTPPANIVFADVHGHIGYWAKGTIPVRSPLSPLGGEMAQDGSSSDYDWLGLIPHELLPWVIDPAEGHVFSANHAPVGSWYPIPLSLATGGKGDTMRSRRLRERLSALDTLTPADMMSIHLDSVHVSRRDVTRLGLAVRQQGYPPGVDADLLNAAFEELKPWLDAGASMTAELPGVALASQFDVKLRDVVGVVGDPGEKIVAVWGGGDNGLQLFLKAMIEKIEAVPPVPLELDEALYVLTRVEEAYEFLIGEAGADPAAWLPWYEENFLTYEFPVWTTLGPFPSLDPDRTFVLGPLTCTDGGTMMSQLGQAFSQRIVLGDSARNKTLMPFGQSELAGPNELDQQALYEIDAFKAAPIAESDILAEGVVSTIELDFVP